MKNLRDSCIEYLQNENTKNIVKEMMKPLGSLIYNEIYIYVWIIAIYNIFFMVMILAMLFILLKLLNKNKLKESILAQLINN